MEFKKVLAQLKEKQFAIAVEKQGDISTILRKKDKDGKEDIIYRYYSKEVDYPDGYSFRPENAKEQKRLFELNWKILK